MNLLEEPIYLDSIVVGDMYHQTSLERALWGRLTLLKGHRAQVLICFALMFRKCRHTCSVQIASTCNFSYHPDIQSI